MILLATTSEAFFIKLLGGECRTWQVSQSRYRPCNQLWIIKLAADEFILNRDHEMTRRVPNDTFPDRILSE